MTEDEYRQAVSQVVSALWETSFRTGSCMCADHARGTLESVHEKLQEAVSTLTEEVELQPNVTRLVARLPGASRTPETTA